MKIYKSTLKKLIKECINEVLEGGNDEGPFAVYQKGGSIGGDKSNYIPRLGGVVNYLFDDVEKAKEVAKKRRKHLSRGEKSYYGMGYGVAKLKPEEIAKLDKSRLHEGGQDNDEYGMKEKFPIGTKVFGQQTPDGQEFSGKVVGYSKTSDDIFINDKNGFLRTIRRKLTGISVQKM